MSDTSATDRQPQTGTGPGFVSPPQPAGPVEHGGQPGPQAQPELPPQGQAVEQEHRWTPEGLVTETVPVLPPERVGKGALLSLLAIPVGVLLAAGIWKLGFVASISGLVLAAGAAVLYVRGSGGRIKKGIPVVALVVLLGIVASFFAVVAVDLYSVFPQLDPSISETYAGRGSFVAENLFYGPVLREYVSTGVMLALFAALGAFGTILRLVRANAALQR
ncbi:hypothetical protein [Microlunatus flavus]|uniref:Uncharacterized protein n=1 Tax=Microlunatus flavus TaxID=1036181 RepID=A0A1H9M058_9ACTN|nr:hypothetical protein [Microlunatus flavus]SER17052.1 hypothetical protein SAMN05421756_109197 [Microlunatus flavus]